jgi:hypothetical protein
MYKLITKTMRNLITTLTISFYVTILFGQNPYDIVMKPSKKSSDKNTTKSDFTNRFPFINPVDWKPGMKFMTEPDRSEFLSSFSKIGLSPYKSIDSYNARIKQSDFQWKTFIYKGLEVRTVNCPRGKCQRTYLIFDCENKKYEYEYVGDTIELRNSIVLNTIDKLVFLDEVDSVKATLVGKIIYIMTNQWMKDDETGQGRYSFTNPKFVAVTITAVGLGSQDGPSKIVFKQVGSETEAYLNIRLSGINKSSGVFGYDFDKVFQFENPKLKYPNISSSVWDKIQSGKVSVGMTKQECELSWGKPTGINKTVTGNEITEQWVYHPSSYLYFTNGILKTIQN